MIFDTDAHVMESEETFASLGTDPRWAHMAPRIIEGPVFPDGPTRAFWLIESRVVPDVLGKSSGGFGTPIKKGTLEYADYRVDSAELTSVQARIDDLDREGIDISVSFPTLFLENQVAVNPGLLGAMVRAYNDWFAAKARGTQGRLRWVAPLPWPDINGSIDELRRAKELGAAGVMLLGTAGEMLLDDPALFPFYAEAERLRVPLCVHIGFSFPPLTAPYSSYQYGPARNAQRSYIAFYTPVHMAFCSFTLGGVLDAFPKLRVGFLEAGIGWLPYWQELMDRGFAEQRITSRSAKRSDVRRITDYIKAGNIYVGTELDERGLGEFVEEFGDECLMYASDLPHAHRVLGAIDLFRGRRDVPEVAKEKILGPNGHRFFEEPL
ncbi:MAG: amidohydrolase [Dehalococcoidia bacterium]|nr:amidohydrolase [Dehalococcoidia bacterium]